MKTNKDPFYPDEYARYDNEEKSKYPPEVDWESIGGDIKYHRDKEGYDIMQSDYINIKFKGEK